MQPLSVGRWYRTGDLGYFDGTGKLHLLGRASSELIGGRTADNLENEMESAIGGGCLVCLFKSRLIEEEELTSSPCSFTCVVRADKDTALLRSACEDGLKRLLGSAAKVDLVITTDEWTAENGMLTVTLKKRRAQVKAKFVQGLFAKCCASAHVAVEPAAGGSSSAVKVILTAGFAVAVFVFAGFALRRRVK